MICKLDQNKASLEIAGLNKVTDSILLSDDVHCFQHVVNQTIPLCGSGIVKQIPVATNPCFDF